MAFQGLNNTGRHPSHEAGTTHHANLKVVAWAMAGSAALGILGTLVAPKQNESTTGTVERLPSHGSTSQDMAQHYWKGIGSNGHEILPPDVLGLSSPKIHSALKGGLTAAGVGALAVAASYAIGWFTRKEKL